MAPTETEIAASRTLATALQKIGIESHAVQEVAELYVGCIHDFALAIEICICMNLDCCIGVDVLEESFKQNGCSQIIALLGDDAE